MPTTDQTATYTLDLSRAEQWVVHHRVHDTLKLLGQGSPGEHPNGDTFRVGRDVVEKIETRRYEFTSRELAFIHRTCNNHAKLTEEVSDRNLASAVTRRIETVLGDSTHHGGGD